KPPLRGLRPCTAPCAGPVGGGAPSPVIWEIIACLRRSLSLVCGLNIKAMLRLLLFVRDCGFILRDRGENFGYEVRLQLLPDFFVGVLVGHAASFKAACSADCLRKSERVSPRLCASSTNLRFSSRETLTGIISFI